MPDWLVSKKYLALHNILKKNYICSAIMIAKDSIILFLENIERL